MRLIPYDDPIPASLGGFDSQATMRAICAAAAEADQMLAERAGRVQYLRDEFAVAMMRGSAARVATFAKPWARIGVPTFGQVLTDALDDEVLQRRAMQLLLDAVHGADVQAAAMQLVVDAGARWADGECA